LTDNNICPISYNVCRVLCVKIIIFHHSFLWRLDYKKILLVLLYINIYINILLVFIRTWVKFLMLHFLFYPEWFLNTRNWTLSSRLVTISYCSRISDKNHQNNGKIFFSCCLFGNSKRYFLVDLLLYENDNYWKMTKECLFLSCFFDKTKRCFIDIF